MPEFVSSHGTIITCQKGFIIENESDLSDWLLDIKQIDVKEVREYMKKEGFPQWETVDYFDILDVGVWLKDDSYLPPEQSWREKVFNKSNT